MSELTVVLADDHVPTRVGVRAVIEREGFRVVAEAGDAEGAVAAAVEHQPDVCLLDVRMPGDGIRAAAEISERAPSSVIVMLTVSRSDSDLFESLRAGAAGYLLKDTDPLRLPLALRGVVNGDAALPRSLVARVIEEFRERDSERRLPGLRQRGTELTEREWEVLVRMRDGLTTAEIARALAISPVTVRRHVSSTLKKLDVPDREAAVRLLDQSSST
jgi:DNA-binding NarL/FixJ family response regulator